VENKNPRQFGAKRNPSYHAFQGHSMLFKEKDSLPENRRILLFFDRYLEGILEGFI